ncbi:type III secretion system needle tip protein SctA [Burkholderia sp. DN3021]|uniref:type III secretion system needle tip protein SctA n=1 Tax=Burkholderia sp. DN3021 TaxID=3410137 RepID=UPI003C7E374D
MLSISNTIRSQFTPSNTAATQQQPFSGDPEIMVPEAATPPGPTLFALSYVREKADGLSELLQGEKKRPDALLDRPRSRTAATSPGDSVQAARAEREQANPNYRAERKLATQQLVNGLHGLTATDTGLTPEQRTQLQQKLKAEHSKYPPGIPAKLNDSVGKTGFDSDAKLWEKIAEYIGNIGEDYLGVYENVVAQYTEFYKAFSDILSKMGGWITPGKDGNSVKLNVTALKNELQKLRDKFSLPSTAGVLFPAKNSDGSLRGANKEKAEEWADALGLPRSCVKEFPAGSGKYAVVADMTPIETMMRDLGGLGSAGNDGNVGLDNAKFQAWQSGFKAQEENLKTTLQTLTQKYSNSNSLYDNLVKVLSSTISSCTETCKSFLQG